MGLFDFLTNSGSSLPQSQQQGLPPQHSTAARILELLGGFTGIMPLAGLGYLADQPTEEAYNVAVWPKIKGMLKDSGVPDQKLADLELLPMSARVGPANQLWQASMKQKGLGKFTNWYQVGPEGRVVSEKVLPEGSPPPGQGWYTSGALASLTKAPPKPAKPFIPNALQARAESILGTTDPTQLGQHPEAEVQAQQEWYQQQRNIAAASRPPREPREPHRQVLLDANGHPTGVIDMDTLKVMPITGAENLYKTLPKTSGGGTSKDEINNALGQMDQMIPLLGTTPGLPAVAGGGIRLGKSLTGYPREAEFQGAAAGLSDMIPKALAGRSSQSAIDNAMKYMVPSLHDTQASARRKLTFLRRLFVQAGALPVGPSVTPSVPTPPPGFE